MEITDFVKNICDNASKEVSLQSKMDSVLSGLKIKGKCQSVRLVDHYAFFDLKLESGASVRKVRSKVEEIALGIQCVTLPIVDVIPSEGVVRLRTAMDFAKPVTVESLYRAGYVCPSEKDMMLPILLGRSDAGENLVVDFAENPHTLIAGGTGSGKSVLLHNIIANLIYLNAAGNRDVELYLIDPKQVEFVSYGSDEFKDHVVDVINTYESTVSLLERLEDEMEKRYTLLKSKGYRSLSDCPSLMSQIVVVIDEVADIILNYDKKSKRFYNSVVSLAQKARAAGIHIIMATQRPSTDVISGLMKANFPVKIACRTARKVDSQVILGKPGAETLMGKGDAIIDGSDFEMSRFQVAFSDPKNTEKTFKAIEKFKKAS